MRATARSLPAQKKRAIMALDIPSAIGAIAALGTAAFGLVDALKGVAGGPSNFGFRYVKTTLLPFAPALNVVGADAFLETLRANWINGMAMDDQKAKAKALIHLGLTEANAKALAQAAGLDAAALAAVAAKIDAGTPLGTNDVNIVGRFDAIVSARLDAGYERADQFYRDASKLLSGIVAIILAVCGDMVLNNPIPLFGAVLIGIVATPLAPIAKDLTSSLAAAVDAISAVKR
jgi:hypothetical protein